MGDSLLEKFKNEAVIAITKHSMIIYCSSAIKAIFGYEPDELVGKLMTVIMPERYRKYHLMGINRYLVTGQRNLNWNSTKLEGLRKDGTEFPVKISFGEYEQEGEKFFIGIICDLSQYSCVEYPLTQKDINKLAKEISATI